ncbi:hypothetical protein VB834_23830 [Limnoraphis robusta Tam1]|uniref:Uncharacterized protein n=1 Tax=Limnoraphis robusta CCNP1315 TaxID=3110306 RepID=A0ABU5U710_9CYAN|nr:hypothetical protein [Limnoraphis robusta]MEA5497434.1 hypothetical protein [Limnoraphis robusta BA-68 BA1]MEA5522835.1 hypothetical protein [Limnoraphis robusta CCNP1315]MEA5542067.1 hypothetical protein [Limnoraphis robusta Tam1]MEA5545691.1 hypothetical protein [Limnoraphis robusta CCNP1324]
MIVPSYLKQVQMGSPGGGRSKEKPKDVKLSEEQIAQITQDKEIKAALGRPIKRIIRDEQGQIILDVGDLITHQAVFRARQAGVLDVLLSSVYRRQSQPSLKS